MRLGVPAVQTAVQLAETIRTHQPKDEAVLPEAVVLRDADILEQLGAVGALRAFVTATPLYVPPLKLEELPYYSGLVNDDTKVLVAMRCQPPHPETIDAVLATWPNVFLAIQRDVPLAADACSNEPTDPATQAACYAKGFSDPPASVVPTSLAHTFSYAGTIFDGNHAVLAKWLTKMRVRRRLSAL